MLNIHGKVLSAYDYLIDKKVCHTSLRKYVPSVFRDDKNGIGSTGSQSTRYLILDRIFSHVNITETDSFIDVGCGKGRVLSYLQYKKYPCKINGVEINEESGKVACDWTKEYDNINVVIGDAFNINYNDYTVVFFGRPFLPKTFLEFIEKFENDVKHPITLIYWVDQQSGYLLKDREGWSMQYREVLSKIKGLYFAGCSQGYSIWTYTPKQ